MRLVLIYGMPAVGKLTVASELAKLTGYPVFHNQLVVDMLAPVFGVSGAAFTEMRESIWMQVMVRATRAGRPGLIFTFTPERTVGTNFIQDVIQELEELGAKVLFVHLKCPEEEVERRMVGDARFRSDKLQSVEYYRELRDLGAFEYPGLPDMGPIIDTSELRPNQAAQRIVDYWKLPSLRAEVKP